MELVNSTVADFVAATASKEPTPGGGAIAALTAATGAALAEMVANLTFNKKGYEDVQDVMHQLQTEAQTIREKALELAEADANVFSLFMDALALPKDTEEEKAIRKAALQQAYKDAAAVPLEIGKISYAIFDLAKVAVEKGNTNLVTDGAIAAINARAAVKSAFLNVRINLMGIQDEAFTSEINQYMDNVEAELDQKEADILKQCKF